MTGRREGSFFRGRLVLTSGGSTAFGVIKRYENGKLIDTQLVATTGDVIHVTTSSRHAGPATQRGE